jgi:hypothetical protein
MVKTELRLKSVALVWLDGAAAQFGCLGDSVKDGVAAQIGCLGDLVKDGAAAQIGCLGMVKAELRPKSVASVIRLRRSCGLNRLPRYG